MVDLDGAGRSLCHDATNNRYQNGDEARRDFHDWKEGQCISSIVIHFAAGYAKKSLSIYRVEMPGSCANQVVMLVIYVPALDR